MKKIFNKLNETTRKTISCLFVLCYTLIQILSPLTTVHANTRDGETPQKGEIRNDSVSVEDSNIKVTKTVTHAKDSNGNIIEGKYNVGFDIVGKETEISTTTPLYAVIVFDTSGSMICSDGSYSSLYNPWFDWGGYDYEAADGEQIRCESRNGTHMADHLTKNKWESAVSGAQDFAKEIMGIENSQVSVVTFSSEANTATNWYTSDSTNLVDETIPAAVFTHPYGGTNLSDGINKAVTKLNTITSENANKVIIVISDGEPTLPDDDDNNTPTQIAINSATNAKNNNIKIFTIGYETDDTADSVLASVSGSNIENDETTYNYTASQGNLDGIFTNVATSISNIVNANTITLTDNLGANFSFSTGSGKTYTKEFETITTEGTHVEFTIDIDPDSPTGWNPTNDGFSLSYNNGTSDVTLSANKNPEVYWIQQEYNYTINYYLDDTNGDPVQTDNGKNVKDTIINVDEEKYLSEYPGYEYTGSNNVTLTISNDESANVINIVYTKKDYNYTVNYYLDEIKETPDHSDTFGAFHYGDEITEINETKYLSQHPGYKYTGSNDLTLTISDNESDNVIDIVYTKKDYSYVVNYYLDNTNSNPVHSDTFGTFHYGDEITEINETKYLSQHPGYEYTGSEDLTLTISDNENDNVINVIYTKKDYNYTVNYYLDDTNGNPVHSDTFESFHYGDEITDINETKYLSQHPGYEYTGSEDLTLTISDNESDNVINIVYTKKDYNYTVNYYLDEIKETPDHSDTFGTYHYGDEITDINETKYLSQHPGYKYTGNENLTLIISDNENNNVINIVYTKIDYTYTIEYYLDNTDGNPVKTDSESGKHYGDPITVDEEKYLNLYPGYEYVGDELDTTVSTIESRNIIKVVYTKANFNLTVNYFFDGVPNTTLSKSEEIQYGTRVYASTYNLTDEETTGYRLHPTNPYQPSELVIDANNNNVININYVSLPSQDNDSISKTTNDTITSTDDTVTYTINYSNTLKNVIGTVTVTIVDTLPLSIDTNEEYLELLNNGQYNSENNTITWTYTYTIDEFKETFDINENFEYTVKYLNINPEYSFTGEVYTNKINSTVRINYQEEEDTLPGTNDEEIVKVEIYGDLIVKYITYNDNNEEVNLMDSLKTNKLVGTPYKTEDKDFYGYKLIDTIGNTTGKYTEEPITVTYVYEKNAGIIDDELSKTTPSDNISGIDSEFNYTITYNATVTDYIGEAKVTITDILPYAINTELSDLDDGTYNIENNTITWIETFNIDKDHTEINIEKNISIIYLDLNNETITNKATSLIELDKNKENDTDETTIKLNKGKVVVHYIEKDTNIKLADDVILEDFVGKTYTTEEKDIDEYFVSDIIGITTSKYTDETIVVTYVYEKLGMGTDILPPQTGINVNVNNPYIFYILSTLLLFIIGLFKKETNN